MKSLNLLFVFSLGAGACFAGESEQGEQAAASARRIAELEERVERLESVVRTLFAGKQQNLELPAENTPDLATRATPEQPLTPTDQKPSPPQELLPALGKIGATASFTTGITSGAYGQSTGWFSGGGVELPLRETRFGRLQYEISIGLSQTSTTLPVSSNVAQVANLAVLSALFPEQGAGNITASLNGAGRAPFPVQTEANLKTQILQVIPFALKFTPTLFDRYKLRPYGVLGLGTYVTISNQETRFGLRENAELSPGVLAALRAAYDTGGPFGGALIGGQLTAAKELTDRGIPAGQGGIHLGLHTGGGIEWRSTGGLSLGLDVRYNRLGNGASFVTNGLRGGFQF